MFIDQTIIIRRFANPLEQKYEAFLQFRRICNPPASDISIFNAKHLSDNI